MRSSIFFAAALFAVVSSLLSCIDSAQKNKVAEITSQQLAGQFLNYVAALNDLYVSGTPPEGDVSDKVILPDWLPRSNSIQLRIFNGMGYVFCPNSGGFYSQLLQETENSGHFGLSDASGINTPTGRLARPDFIPSGYVVYVR